MHDGQTHAHVCGTCSHGDQDYVHLFSTFICVLSKHVHLCALSKHVHHVRTEERTQWTPSPFARNGARKSLILWTHLGEQPARQRFAAFYYLVPQRCKWKWRPSQHHTPWKNRKEEEWDIDVACSGQGVLIHSVFLLIKLMQEMQIWHCIAGHFSYRQKPKTAQRQWHPQFHSHEHRHCTLVSQ